MNILSISYLDLIDTLQCKYTYILRENFISAVLLFYSAAS